MDRSMDPAAFQAAAKEVADRVGPDDGPPREAAGMRSQEPTDGPPDGPTRPAGIRQRPGSPDGPDLQSMEDWGRRQHAYLNPDRGSPEPAKTRGDAAERMQALNERMDNPSAREAGRSEAMEALNRRMDEGQLSRDAPDLGVPDRQR